MFTPRSDSWRRDGRSRAVRIGCWIACWSLAACELSHPSAPPADDVVITDTLSDGGADVDEAPLCAPGLEFCGGRCVDVSVDTMHCGRCDNGCAAGRECVARECVARECVGGTVSDVTLGDARYRVHEFTKVGVATLRCASGMTVEYLVIGGGGGGGGGNRCGGGGGAGGYLAGTLTVSDAEIAVSVGRGGAVAANGDDSSFGDVIARGGGAGGDGARSSGDQGEAGGSGGGAGFKHLAGGTSTPGQGNAGGDSRDGNYTAGGGGGGAGGAGAQGAGSNAGIGGAGGAGLGSNITGVAVTRGGGGAGRGEHGNGAAGDGGGGAVLVAGVTNTGGGGGADAPGGSGVVIVRYRR